MGGCCGLAVLCVGAVAALTAMALVSIAANTDHWVEARVDRAAVAAQGMAEEPDSVYYSRARGLFRVCFPATARPPASTPGLFLSPVEDWCLARHYHLAELLRGHLGVTNLTEAGLLRLQLARATPALLVFYLAIMAAIGLLGLVGCWQQSANKLIVTAAVQLLAALVGATAMATWHAALFMEMEKVLEPGFPLMWPEWLQKATAVGTGWSYLVAWAGVCITLLASLATSASAIALRARASTWQQETLRMKMRVNSLLAGHAYYPGDLPSGYSPQPQHYRPMSGIGLSRDSPSLSADTFVDYKKVMGELENSKF